jgi:phosphoribosylanthranilate isomerase
VTDFKFCGLTRSEDALAAGEFGAAYIGVIFAGGPRQLTPERALVVLDGCGTAAKRVGVFGRASPEEIAKIASAVKLDVVQLSGDPTAADVKAVRAAAGIRVWAVIRVEDSLPSDAESLFDSADAVVLDARVDGMLGGTGVTISWADIAQQVAAVRRGRSLVLAGGLRPENVAKAIKALAPNVLDVSSGVESAPGIKDHARMRAFAAAAASQTEKR